MSEIRFTMTPISPNRGVIGVGGVLGQVSAWMQPEHQATKPSR